MKKHNCENCQHEINEDETMCPNCLWMYFTKTVCPKCHFNSIYSYFICPSCKAILFGGSLYHFAIVTEVIITSFHFLIFKGAHGEKVYESISIMGWCVFTFVVVLYVIDHKRSNTRMKEEVIEHNKELLENTN